MLHDCFLLKLKYKIAGEGILHFASIWQQHVKMEFDPAVLIMGVKEYTAIGHSQSHSGIKLNQCIMEIYAFMILEH